MAWRLQLVLNGALTFSENNQAAKPVKLYFDAEQFSGENFNLLQKSDSLDYTVGDEFKTGQVFDGKNFDIEVDGQRFPIQYKNNSDPVIAWVYKAENDTTKMELIPGALTNQQAEGPIRHCSLLDQAVKCVEYSRENSPVPFKNGATYIESVPVTEGRSISVAYIIPQYFVLTFGEVLLSTTALEFSYTQAPSSVKAISTALWYCTTAFANLVVILLKSMKSLSRDTQLLLSAFMVVAATIAFIMIGWNFTVYSQNDIDRLDRDDSESSSYEGQDVDNSQTPMIKNSNA